MQTNNPIYPQFVQLWLNPTDIASPSTVSARSSSTASYSCKSIFPLIFLILSRSFASLYSSRIKGYSLVFRLRKVLSSYERRGVCHCKAKRRGRRFVVGRGLLVKCENHRMAAPSACSFQMTSSTHSSARIALVESNRKWKLVGRRGALSEASEPSQSDDKGLART